MINTVSSFYMLGVAEAGMLLQFPFLVREKGALIDRQSLSLSRALRGLWEASVFQKINFRNGLLPIGRTPVTFFHFRI